MAERSRASFKTEYTSSGTGAFKDQSVKAITAGVMRTHSTDISDSNVMFEDLKPVTASGTDTYTVSCSPTLTSYSNGRLFLVLFTNANTGAATLNVDSLGAKNITKNGTEVLVANDITAGSIKLLSYDGTQFQVIAGQNTGLMYRATVTLSSAEILALNTTPKQVIAAPGANKVIQVHSFYWKYTYNSVAYASFGNIQLIYDTVTGDGIVDVTSALNGSASKWAVQGMNVVNTTTDITNKAVKIQVQSGNPTAGNGTAEAIVYYSIINV